MRLLTLSLSALIPTLVVLSSEIHAGPYSPGAGETGYADTGIAGFVGPAGDGVAATETNGNHVNPVFVGWATGYVTYSPSNPTRSADPSVTIPAGGNQTYIGTNFSNPLKALGPVTGNNFDIVSLGDMSAAELAAYHADPAGASVKPGELILTFDRAITNGTGADFATFENGFVSGGKMFAELGFVEVSTDGFNFARFPSIYLNAAPTGSQAYWTQDPSNIYNLVGKHNNAYSSSWGTPFDLDDLLDDPLVIAGLVDLFEINYVKIVDIPGDGSFTDSEGNPIYDAWQTWGSGGVDFEALGVIHAVPEPAAAALWMSALCALVVFGKRRRETRK